MIAFAAINIASVNVVDTVIARVSIEEDVVRRGGRRGIRVQLRSEGRQKKYYNVIKHNIVIMMTETNLKASDRDKISPHVV